MKYWPTVRDFFLIALGALVQAAALRIFLVPANLASGGVSGISQLINYYTGWPIGMMVFIGNLPLFVLGWRFLGGRRFAMRTAFAIAIYSFLVDTILFLPFFPKNGLTDDIVLNSLYGADANGDWTLFLADFATGSQGDLVKWGLEVTAVPEPAALPMMAMGGLGFGLYLWRRRSLR